MVFFRSSDLFDPGQVGAASRAQHGEQQFGNLRFGGDSQAVPAPPPGGDRRVDRRSFEPRRFGRRDRGARVPDGKTESPGNGAATA